MEDTIGRKIELEDLVFLVQGKDRHYIRSFLRVVDPYTTETCPSSSIEAIITSGPMLM